MIDFPASPTLGQQFTAAGVTWVWDGTKWTPAGASSAVVQAMNDNRIINGDMRIDQRNNGATGTGSVYTVDRWAYISNLTKGTWGRNYSGPGPAGFPYYLGFQSNSAYTSLAADQFQFGQPIEADMISDFQWGTAGAQPVTLSFWAISSLTGTFSGSICNYAGTRSYPFIFSLPTAITWTRIIITIPGDTSGTWVLSGNAGSMYVRFDLGTGSNGRGPANAWAAGNYIGATGSVSVVSTNAATFFLTGVKLETGSIATPFNRQSLAKSLADCQRYFSNTSGIWFQAYAIAAYILGQGQTFPTMRAQPTITFSGITYTNSSGLTVAQAGASSYALYVTSTTTGMCGIQVASIILTAEL